MSQNNVIIKKQEGLEKDIIVVSKEYSKKAVERNKTKRRIREIIRELNKGKKYKIILKPSAKDLSYQELKKEINKTING